LPVFLCILEHSGVWLLWNYLLTKYLIMILWRAKIQHVYIPYENILYTCITRHWILYWHYFHHTDIPEQLNSSDCAWNVNVYVCLVFSYKESSKIHSRLYAKYQTSDDWRKDRNWVIHSLTLWSHTMMHYPHTQWNTTNYTIM